MNTLFTRLWFVAAMTCAVASANAATDEAGNNFIYFGSMSKNNYPPHIQYADDWEAGKMYETAPGSNIYEIVADTRDLTWGAWFHFYYELADTEDVSAAYYLNIIQPKGGRDAVAMPMVGRSGIYATDDVEKTSITQSTGTWHLPDGKYRFRLDMNENKLYAIPEGEPLLLVRDNDDFSWNLLERYSSLTKINNYYEPGGNLTIRMYDPFNQQWLVPNGSAVLTTGTSKTLDYTPSSTRDDAFVVSDWGGGVLRGGAKLGTIYRIDIMPDTPSEIAWTPIDKESISVVGDFSGWRFTTVSRKEGTEAVYDIEFPAGTDEFKIVLGNSWDFPQLGTDGSLKTEGENKVMGLALSETGNLENSRFPGGLAEPVTVSINLTTGKATFPANCHMTMGVANSQAVAPVNRTDLFVQTPYDSFSPWKDCSDAVLSSFQSVPKISDDTYSGRIYVPAGEFNLRFISELTALGTPNKVLAPPTGEDRELAISGNVAYSSASVLSSDRAGYWTYQGKSRNDGWEGGYVTVTVTTGSSYSVKFEFSSMQGDEPASEIYLIGSPQGWDISDGSMPLKLTSKGGYYGWYDISSSDVYFRFYTELGIWDDEHSIGSGTSWNDLEISLPYGSCYEGFCNTGNQGNWYVSGWSGGTMYFYVSPSDRTICVSREPIEAAGEIIDPSTVKTLYLYNNGEYVKMEKGKDGLYQAQTYLYVDVPDETGEFRLFTKKLPISTEEPAWEGSFALSATSDALLEFDDMDVAEATFTIQDEVTTAGAKPFRLTNHHNFTMNNYYVSVDLENRRLYVERDYRGFYLCGGLTEGRFPTYANRKEFAKYRIPCSGGLMDIPAGKLDFTLCPTIATAQDVDYKQTVTFNDGFAEPEYRSWAGTHVTCPDWNGGKVLVTDSYMLDFSTISELTCYTAIGLDTYTTSTSAFTQTAPGSLVFKGKAKFADRVNPWMDFHIKRLENRTINVASRTCYTGTGGNPMYEGENIVVPVDGAVNTKLGFNGQSFSFPSLVGSGEMDVTLDLNNMTLTATIPTENEGSIYEAVSGSNPDLDGMTGYPSTEQDDAVVLEAQVSGESENGYDFNLTTPDGSVIAPANTTVVNFDQTGSWSGPFVKSSAAAPGRNAVRRAASQSATWHFDMPEGQNGTLSMLIDEANSTLTIFSSAHNSGYFILGLNNDLQASVEMLPTLRGNMLTRSNGTTYDGEITLGSEALSGITLRFAKDFAGMYGVYTPMYSLATLDLTGDNRVASQPALREGDTNMATFWTIKAPAGKVAISYDPVNGKLTADRGSAGVDNVLADAATGISVAPGEGCVVITSSQAARLTIYSVTGAVVRVVDVQSGQTTVELPAGLYIVNREKLYVR